MVALPNKREVMMMVTRIDWFIVFQIVILAETVLFAQPYVVDVFVTKLVDFYSLRRIR